jgi:hypothetical protein
LLSRLLRFGALSFLVVVLTYGFYSILRLSPFFYIIEEKNAVFVYPLREWLKHPFLQLLQNSTALFDWYIRYVGIPQTIFAAASFFVVKKFFREKLLLLVWFLLPLIALAFMGKQIYPRYIFFMTLSLLPLISFSIVQLSNRWKNPGIKTLIFAAAISYSLYASLLILLNPASSPIPGSDKGQYITAWPSGVGITETTAFFMKEAEKGKIVLATEGTFGLLPYAYELYLVQNPNITIKGYWPIESSPPEELVAAAKEKPVYVVFYQECPVCAGTGLAPETWPVTQVMQVKKPQPNSYLTVYRLLSQ